ncbi:MAG TPA: hypothetical protein VFO63_12150 [Blastocatellia bacterium]|nr:hypothetical protein [Blastocatellia bacterium]
MKVTIYFKAANQWRHYSMDEEEFKRLQEDFSNFLKSGEPKGGGYTMAVDEMYADTTPRTVLLKFDDITFA